MGRIYEKLLTFSRKSMTSRIVLFEICMIPVYIVSYMYGVLTRKSLKDKPLPVKIFGYIWAIFGGYCFGYCAGKVFDKAFPESDNVYIPTFLDERFSNSSVEDDENDI